MTHQVYMLEAIKLAHTAVHELAGGPFGAVIVKNGIVIGRGHNAVISNKDPTAHSEVTAIRAACQYLNNFSLEGCEIYSTCEPCMMCLGAIYWARIKKIYYGANREDAAAIGFDDHLFYQEFKRDPDKRSIPMIELLRDEALVPFKEWDDLKEKIRY